MALAVLLPTGVLFGTIHALTPGHGKSILASYLLGSRLAALRGTAVAAVMALTHVGTAVLIALTAAPLITRTLGGVGRAPALEFLSRGLLVAIALWLILRAWRRRSHPHGEGVAVGFVAGLVEDKNAIQPMESAIQSDLRDTLSEVLTALTPREERVIRMRFGLGNTGEHTLEEVGTIFGVTCERIRQIEAKALRKLNIQTGLED